MKKPLPENPSAIGGNQRGLGWLVLIVGGALLVVLIGILLPRPLDRTSNKAGKGLTNHSQTALSKGVERSTQSVLFERFRVHGNSTTAPTAEEIVADQLGLIAHNRHEILHKMAEAWNLQVPADFDSFFDMAEAGRWDELQDLFGTMMTNRMKGVWSEGASRLWPAVTQTFGIAEAAHKWPAQRLLDYGAAVLDSLPPETIYAGGNSAAYYIPTLLDETTDGPQRVTLTQNALADATYLDYVSFLYGDRLHSLTHEESQEAFETYLADAKKRLEHDRDFPNEPKQLRPGEDIEITEGRVQVSGQVAVMAINEKLFQTLMDKNPDSSFAIAQSFPFESTYADATPVGPIMALRVSEEKNKLTAARASEAVNYWATTTEQLLADPAADVPDVRKEYAKMASDQAALLLDRNFPAEAEQTLQYALQISPSSPAIVFRYISLLTDQKRIVEAISAVDNAAKADPGNEQFRQVLEVLKQQKH